MKKILPKLPLSLRERGRAREYNDLSDAVRGSIRLCLIACLLISSCANKGNIPVCPNLAIVPDASFMNQYEEGMKNIYSHAVIDSAEGYCKKEEGNVTIAGSFDMQAVLSEMPEITTNVPIDYFVAVLDEKNNVVVKNNYISNMKFKKNRVSNSQSIDFEEHVNLKSDDLLSKYNILIGLQLTEVELEDNRDSNKPY